MQLQLDVQEAALDGDNETPRTLSTVHPAASEDPSRTCREYKTPEPHIHPQQPLCISTLMVWTHLKAKGNLMRSAVMRVVLLTSGPLRCKKTSENTMMDYKNTKDCKSTEIQRRIVCTSRKSGRTGRPLSHRRPSEKKEKRSNREANAMHCCSVLLKDGRPNIWNIFG